MQRLSRIALFIALFAFGLEVASATRSQVIHNWTVSTPLGEFGYVEIGGVGTTDRLLQV
jgi:hypothetical protein